MAGYIGVEPVPQAIQTRQIFSASSGQTTFNTAGYTPGYIDVYLNGIKLVVVEDYSAPNGHDVVLNIGADEGDVLEIVAFSQFEIGQVAAGATGGGADQVFYENDVNVTSNYSITSGKHAHSVGPLTIASGVTITIPTGSRWVIS
jgi:hypothetical protein